jgi:hypothetical protein
VYNRRIAALATLTALVTIVRSRLALALIAMAEGDRSAFLALDEQGE